MIAKPFDKLQCESAPASLYNSDEMKGHLWPDARFLYDLWQDKKGERKACSRSDLTPKEMITQLPWIAIHDVALSPFRMKVRLIGTQFVEAIGMDATGQFVDEMDNTAKLIDRAYWVASNCEPILYVGLELIWSPNDYKHYDSLILPLINDENEVNMLLYFNQFY
jgi:hypothetical protein